MSEATTVVKIELAGSGGSLCVGGDQTCAEIQAGCGQPADHAGFGSSGLTQFSTFSSRCGDLGEHPGPARCQRLNDVRPSGSLETHSAER
jgi:hypothetical protein